MGATLFSPRCQGNLKDAPLSHPLSFVRSAACTTFSVASCTITHMEDKHASIHMHLFTWKMHRKILEYHDGAVPEIEAWVAHHVAIPRPNSGVYACVPFKPAPPQTRCCPIVSKYLRSIAQCASTNMVLSAKDLDYHSQHILITCHACIICIKTCLGTRRKQELELEGGWFFGGTGIFMSRSNDSVDQRAVGFKVGPRNAAMQIAFRNTNACGHPSFDLSWKYLITDCQLGR